MTEEAQDNICGNLLIVGNGMDLSCKLKSNYDNFYQNIYKDKILKCMNIENRATMDIRYEEVCEFGLIDFILIGTINRNNDEIHWNDIETTIANIVDPSYEYNIQNLLNTFESIVGLKEAEDENTVVCKIRKKIVNCLVAKNILSIKEYEREKSKKNLELELIDSIDKLEEKFKKHMKIIVSSSGRGYNANLNKLYKHMVGGKPQNTYVINFNYTSEKFKTFYALNNVHGSLDNEDRIIFGIDENSDYEETSEKKTKLLVMEDYRLTKTYKKLSLESAKVARVKPLPKTIKNIKFFGHSLSSADYAYFQSIFDYYNIYESNINVIFYYVDYDKKKAFTNQMEGVINLMKKYGHTMGNKNHGKNLLHKLSLEGRLKIQEVKIEYKDDKIVNVE